MPVFDIKEPLAFLREGKADEAIPMLEHLVQITPGHVTAYVLLAQAYASEARWRDAMSTWQQAAFLMPNSPAIIKGLEHAMQMFSIAGSSINDVEPAPVVEPEGHEEAVDSEPEADLEPAAFFYTETIEQETEVVLEDATDLATGEVTEFVTDNAAERLTDDVTEYFTEDATEQSSDNVTDYFSDDVTEYFSEDATEQSSDNVTELLTEQATEQLT
ncbi:MAG: tetratricopeptide repeat protein, partial [Rhodothermales bacterium]|nr:tetratricopeptide repeat protein [Rhodothermales bacterium]